MSGRTILCNPGVLTTPLPRARAFFVFLFVLFQVLSPGGGTRAAGILVKIDDRLSINRLTSVVLSQRGYKYLITVCSKKLVRTNVSDVDAVFLEKTWLDDQPSMILS